MIVHRVGPDRDDGLEDGIDDALVGAQDLDEAGRRVEQDFALARHLGRGLARRREVEHRVDAERLHDRADLGVDVDQDEEAAEALEAVDELDEVREPRGRDVGDLAEEQDEDDAPLGDFAGEGFLEETDVGGRDVAADGELAGKRGPLHLRRDNA
jgi:hypothetical protein